MTPRSHHSRQATDARVIVCLRERWPGYRWRYRLRRSMDALWPTYVAIGDRQRRTVAWITVDNCAAWRWTDSREPALPVVASQQHSGGAS